jgi:hypothetical protein
MHASADLETIFCNYLRRSSRWRQGWLCGCSHYSFQPALHMRVFSTALFTKRFPYLVAALAWSEKRRRRRLPKVVAAYRGSWLKLWQMKTAVLWRKLFCFCFKCWQGKGCMDSYHIYAPLIYLFLFDLFIYAEFTVLIWLKAFSPCVSGTECSSRRILLHPQRSKHPARKLKKPFYLNNRVFFSSLFNLLKAHTMYLYYQLGMSSL